MSSILKALKKLEVEKSLLDAKKEINVSREILKQSSENRNMVKWLWLLGSTAAAVIIFLSFALIRKPSANIVEPSRELPLAVQTAPVPLPVLNQLIAPQSSTNTKNIPITSPSTSNYPAQKQALQIPAQTNVGSTDMREVELPSTAVPLPEPQKIKPPLKTAPLPAPTSSELTFILSGIAWNKDGAERMAIINGQPTATGSTINGVTVEEILQDKVKLSHNGRSFELLIGRPVKMD